MSAEGAAAPAVSIIVPVCNQEAYLPTCIRSLQMQTMRNIEILLVDDGSNDGSAEICDAAEASDTRMNVLHQKNAGATAARKAGLRMASAPYVTFVDSDDWIEPELCETLYDMAVSTGAELVIGAHFREDEDMQRVERSSLPDGYYHRQRMERDVFPKLFHNDFRDAWSIYPYLCGKLFLRRQLQPLLERVDDDIRLGEDACVTYPYILQSQSLAIVHRPLYHYAQHEGSQVRQQLAPRYLGTFQRIDELLRDSKIEQNSGHSLEQRRRTYLLKRMLLPRCYDLLLELSAYDFVFPFRDVPAGSRVIIYGAGVWGTSLHNFLHRTKLADVVLWLDARAPSLRKYGLAVSSLQEVGNWPAYDHVLIVIMKSSTAQRVRKDLIEHGVSESKIEVVDEVYVTSDETWRRCGF